MGRPEECALDLRLAGNAEQLTAETLLATVASQSRATAAEAQPEHTAAGLTVLRQWAPRELLDTVGQLPGELSNLLC